MTAVLTKFSPPKSESWRFSGLKELDLSTFSPQKPESLSVKTFLGDIPEGLVEAKSGEIKTVVDTLSDKNDLCVFARRLIAGEGATLNYVLLNFLPDLAKNFNFLEVEAHKDSKVNLTLINLGSAYTRQEITALMKGRCADVKFRSLSIAKGAQEIDQRTLQIHEAPNAKSDLLFKNVLSDKARTIFAGMIRVSPGAQKTDAYQKNRNLILSDEAQANSLPGLEIEANDVRCTHGATCGRLDPEELFYLRARGIPLPEAKQMLVGGYCEEVLECLPEETANEVRKRIGIAE